MARRLVGEMRHGEWRWVVCHPDTGQALAGGLQPCPHTEPGQTTDSAGDSEDTGDGRGQERQPESPIFDDEPPF